MIYCSIHLALHGIPDALQVIKSSPRIRLRAEFESSSLTSTTRNTHYISRMKVIIIGASGETGRSIVKGLLESTTQFVCIPPD